MRDMNMRVHGVKLVSINVAGISAFKLFLMLESTPADVFCL